MTNDVIYSSAATLAQSVKDKKMSAVELLNLYLQRIEEVNPKLNAVVQLATERSLAEAREADDDLQKGRLRGPLHGLPITLKDSIDTEGIISTGGTKGRERFKPDKDATVVARLRAAGAIVIGKTNTPELTLDGETYNLVYGRTNNPYDLSKTTGGSSGGAAATVAAAGAALDFGTDTGGSIRAPAHFCGITGIKPTAGRIPRTGHIVPYGLGARDMLTQIGPMARYVEDLMLALPILCGTDGYDPAIIPMPLGDANTITLKGLRVAVHMSNGITNPTAETVETVNHSSASLRDAGVAIEENLPSALKDSVDLYRRLDDADGQAWVKRLLKKAGTRDVSPAISRDIEAAKPISSEELTALLEEIDQFRSEMLQFMRDYDAILCPVVDYPAPPHAPYEPKDEDTCAHNMTGWPAAVVRAGTSSDGMPIGVQVVAPPWRDDVALALARHIETSLGGYQKPNI